MSVTYGNVPLSFPTSEAMLWIDQNITLRDVLEFSHPTWPGRNRVQWPWPLWSLNQAPQIGRLHWPVGASRWATFHFLVTDVQLKLIRSQAYAGGYRSLNLVLDDGRGFPVTIPMYLMPSRPLAQVEVGKQLFLLTLVDLRYFWWEIASTITVTGGTTTWATLFSDIATALGVTILNDAISGDYLKPASDLTARYEFLPMLLDAACMNIGQRLVRSFNGDVSTQSATTAILSQANQYANWDRQAGGKFALTASEALSHDLQALVPASVVVAFPRTDNGVPSASLYAVTKTLASLALTEYAGATGHNGSKFFRDEPVATYAGGADPTNLAELGTLAARIATDFYLWRLNKLDVAYCGAVPWTPEGMGDLIFDWRAGICQTRVTPCETLNALTEELNHYGTNGTLPTGFSVPDPLVLQRGIINNGTTQEPFQTPVTISSTPQNDYPSVHKTIFAITPTVNVSLTGIVAIGPGQRLEIVNTSTTKYILIPSASGSSTAANQFILPTGTSLVIPPTPGKTLIEWDDIQSRWIPFISPTYKPSIPSAITSTQNDYSLSTGVEDKARISSDATRIITGFSNGWPEREVELSNVGSFAIEIANQDGGSSAANQVITPTGTAIVLPPDSSVKIKWDDTNSKWRVLDTVPTFAESSPAQITSNQNDYSPGNATVLRLSTDANRDLTGISGGWPSRRLVIMNVGTHDINFKDLSGSSSAANQIHTPNSTDFPMPGGTTMELIYDSVTAIWRFLSPPL